MKSCVNINPLRSTTQVQPRGWKSWHTLLLVLTTFAKTTLSPCAEEGIEGTSSILRLGHFTSPHSISTSTFTFELSSQLLTIWLRCLRLTIIGSSTRLPDLCQSDSSSRVNIKSTYSLSACNRGITSQPWNPTQYHY